MVATRDAAYYRIWIKAYDAPPVRPYSFEEAATLCSEMTGAVTLVWTRPCGTRTLTSAAPVELTESVLRRLVPSKGFRLLITENLNAIIEDDRLANNTEEETDDLN